MSAGRRATSRRLIRRRARRNHVALALEVALHDLGDAGLVFDQQDTRLTRHESIVHTAATTSLDEAEPIHKFFETALHTGIL